MKAEDAFHDHIDICQRCRENPFDLCTEGMGLLYAVAAELNIDPMFRRLEQWNRVVNRGEAVK